MIGGMNSNVQRRFYSAARCAGLFLALAVLPAALAPTPINTPNDTLGAALDTSDFIKPGFQADFTVMPAITHDRIRRQPARPLTDPAFTWTAGYVHAKPALGIPVWNPPGHKAPGFSWLPAELAVYPNEDAIDAGGYSPFSMVDHAFRITAAPTPDKMRTLIPLGWATDYISGAINSYPFSQTYGYFEMTARVPHGRALWPAFWLLPTDMSWPPEIDVMEILGQDTTKLYTSVHSKKLSSGTWLGQEIKSTDLSAGYHRYGVDWGPAKIRFYLDRKLVFSEPTPDDMHQPFYILANLAVGGPHSWPGAPDAATPFPAHFDITHIAAWQRRAYSESASNALALGK
jgi:hypothetical protein